MEEQVDLGHFLKKNFYRFSCRNLSVYRGSSNVHNHRCNYRYTATKKS